MPRTRSLAWAELRLGLVGIAALVLAVVLILAVGGQGGFFWQRYGLKARFDAVGGLKTGAIVRLAGKDVGKVTSVEFAGTKVDVAMEVSKDVHSLVTTESVASIGSLGLLGEPIIDITMAPSGGPLPPWGYVPTSEHGGMLGSLTSSVNEGLTTAKGMMDDVRAGRGTLGKLVTDDKLYADMRELMQAATRVAHTIEKGPGTLGRLSSDPAAYDALKASLENVRAITARFDTSKGTLNRLINDDTTINALDGSLASLRLISDRLAKGEGTAGRLLTERQLYDDLSALTGRLDRTVADIQSGRGTVGRLLHDEQLYDNLNKTVLELRGLLTDIRRDPKKYLHMTFSIF